MPVLAILIRKETELSQKFWLAISSWRTTALTVKRRRPASFFLAVPVLGSSHSMKPALDGFRSFSIEHGMTP